MIYLKIRKRNYWRNTTNKIVHNYLSKKQFHSESVLFWETTLLAHPKKMFDSFTWNVFLFTRKNFWKASLSVKRKSVRIPLCYPFSGRCRSHILISSSLGHILILILIGHFLFFPFSLGFWDSWPDIITATEAQYESPNRRGSVLLMLVKYHSNMFLYN